MRVGAQVWAGPAQGRDWPPGASVQVSKDSPSPGRHQKPVGSTHAVPLRGGLASTFHQSEDKQQTRQLCLPPCSPRLQPWAEYRISRGGEKVTALLQPTRAQTQEQEKHQPFPQAGGQPPGFLPVEGHPRRGSMNVDGQVRWQHLL